MILLPEYCVAKVAICSIAHITENDNSIFESLAFNTQGMNDSEWVHDTGYGYLIRFSAVRYPLLHFKKQGVSKQARWFFYNIHHVAGYDMIQLDNAFDPLPDFEVMEW